MKHDTKISLLFNVIAACCTCEVHGDAFDEEWTFHTAEVPNNETASSMTTVEASNAEHICNALADYVYED